MGEREGDGCARSHLRPLFFCIFLVLPDPRRPPASPTMLVKMVVKKALLVVLAGLLESDLPALFPHRASAPCPCRPTSDNEMLVGKGLLAGKPFQPGHGEHQRACKKLSLALLAALATTHTTTPPGPITSPPITESQTPHADNASATRLCCRTCASTERVVALRASLFDDALRHASPSGCCRQM